jgi:4-hydroxy-3-polyprenylbenzoate decarboxylase
MFASLREFVESLDHAGELVTIDDPVDPVLEIAEIADRVSKSAAPGPAPTSEQRTDPRFHDRGGPALLFTNVIGSDIPLLINAFGSYRRVAMALGAQGEIQGPDDGRADGLDALARTIGELVKPEPPKSLREAITKAKQFAPLLKIGPKRRRYRLGGGPACQELVYRGEHVDLSMLPIIRCWPHDGDFAALGYPPDVNAQVEGMFTDPAWRGRYITLAGIHTIHADDEHSSKPSSHNIGMYRVQALGPRRCAMHWHMHHDGAAHWRSWKRKGEPMPVAIVLGGESVLPYAATAPLPPGISELLMAGFLNRGGVELARAVSVPLWVPANADIVIEGYVHHDAGGIGWDPRDEHAGPLGPGAVFEGPFGDHTGFYSMPDRYPIVEVTAITHRRRPIYPTTIVGLPPQEDYYLGKATERLFFPLLKTLIHDIEDYDLPLFGAFHNCAFVRINKAYPLQARRVMSAIWGAGQMAWTKTVFVVDDHVDVHDLGAVLRELALHCDPRRDLELHDGPLDILDHAAPRLAAGQKIGFDCTRKWPGEEVAGVPIDPAGDGGDPDRRTLTGAARDEYLDAVRALPGVRDAAMPELTHGGWLFVRTDKPAADGAGDSARASGGATFGRELLARLWPVGCDADFSAQRLPRFIALLGPDVDVHDADTALFHWVANMDPSRDMVFSPELRVGPSGRGQGESAADADAGAGASTLPARTRVAFDATPKGPADAANGQPVRAWPPVLSMPAEVVERVRERWGRSAMFGSGE